MLHISGSGSVQNSDLETADTDIHISGSGKASVNATRSLGVNISGSGSVFYRGQPQRPPAHFRVGQSRRSLR